MLLLGSRAPELKHESNANEDSSAVKCQCDNPCQYAELSRNMNDFSCKNNKPNGFQAVGPHLGQPQAAGAASRKVYLML